MRSRWYCKYKLAHRGLHNDKFPENSLGAFENACKNGFAIELDVRLLQDGTPVILHDPTLLRMCGVDKRICNITIDELKNYTLGKSKYSIPTLQEVLDLVNSRVPIMIELKPVKRKEKIEQKVYEIIKDYQGDIAVKSFNPLSMIWFKRHAPEIIRGMLASSFNDVDGLPRLYKRLIKKLSLFRLVKPDFISYNHEDLPNKYVTKRKVPVLAWTIIDAESEKRALLNANNVIFEGYIPKSNVNY